MTIWVFKYEFGEMELFSTYEIAEKTIRECYADDMDEYEDLDDFLDKNDMILYEERVIDE